MEVLTEHHGWWVMDTGRGHPPASLLKHLPLQAACSGFPAREGPLWSPASAAIAAQVDAPGTGAVPEVEIAGSSREQ